ncbi:hypothetical protein KL946_004107 [Ogataea haglerorum]|uniref:Uncharacterized protein n=1 Tax=Ogataea haglerorum TaxID=1937702 RepID=A0ABQ7RCV5_9ASCO|nr:hypothetical protein KL946_004107 [Ogataea haglerorum]
MDFEAILTLKTPGDDLADQGLFRPWSMKQRQHDKEPAADSAVFFSKSDTFKSFSVNDPMENYFSLAERKNDNFFTGHDDSFTEQSITPTKHNVASRLGTTARVPSLRYDLAPPRFAGLFETPKPETPFQPGARNTRASSFAVQSFPFMERVPLRPAAETSRPSSKRELSAHLESSKSVRHRRKSVSLFLTQLFDKFLQKKDEAPKSARSIKSVKSYNFLNQSADIYNDIIDYYNDASNVERGRSMVRRPAKDRSVSVSGRGRRDVSLGSQLLPTATIFDEATSTPFFKDLAGQDDAASSVNTKTTTLRRLRADLDRWWRRKTMSRSRRRENLELAAGIQPGTAELVCEKKEFEATSTPLKDKEQQEVLVTQDKFGHTVRNVIETRILVVENEPNMDEMLKQGSSAPEWLKADLLSLIQNGNLRIFKEKSGRNFITVEVTELPEL